ncbi:MAG: transcription-repair coupling factor [bacterium]
MQHPPPHPAQLLDPVFQATLRRVEGKKPLVLNGVRGGGKAWFLAELARRVAQPLVVVTESFQQAEELQQDLAFFSGAGRAFFFPPWDTIPYDSFSPNKDLVARRFEALAALMAGRCPILVTTPEAMMQGMIPAGVLRELSFTLDRGGRYPRQELVTGLIRAGFVRVDLVEERGEFSARGEIVDVFPIDSENPVRLDFFDDDLENLRFFDVGTQKSFGEITEVTVFPAAEAVVSPATVELALRRLPDYKAGVQPETYRQVYHCLEQGTSFPGAEQLLGLFYRQVGRLHEVLPPESVVFLDEPERLFQRSRDFFDEVLVEYEFSLGQGNLALSPETTYLSPAQFKAAVDRFYCPELMALRIEERGALACPFADNQTLRSVAASEAASAHATLGGLVKTLQSWAAGGASVCLTARSQTAAERLRGLLAEFDVGAALESDPAGFLARQLRAPGGPADGAELPGLTVFASGPAHGFRVVDGEGNTRFALVSEEELLGEKIRPRRLKKTNLQHFIASLGDLKAGDLVVHLEYGIGRYEGLKKLTAGREEGDFLELSYAGGDKVYVPVYRLNQVQKFTGVAGAAPAVNRLGDGAWQRSKQKASRVIQDMAEELLRVQAARKTGTGHAFEPSEGYLTEFGEAFPFQETEDQQQAIEQVLADMAKDAPMDRLVCGDVGFGKTEVAMRAAYLAVLGGKQVMVLVPTTVLAQQHFETFRARFDGFGVRVEVLSRFLSPREQKAVVKAFGEGKADILIGTHRLFSKDVQPRALGLLVVDEEQRFGVAHKEKIKRLRTQVDVVTLSATPIPRTLHMALVGVRDLSVISTPPLDRVAVRTRLVKASDYIIREAVEREIRRGGQVFYVHNKVETIHAQGSYLQSLLPRARIGVAHGQMAEKQLEEMMLQFVQGNLDVLLTTTIIESGLDIPRANTIIINQADKFGLAQLYQLRGRVGRSNVQAFAYLMVSAEKVLTDVAQKRLTLLQEFNDLGSGFKIASHDLEIRGAGNLLGQEQSGHVNTIGLELYTGMVKEAIAKLRGEEAAPQPDTECRLDLGFPYLLPDGFIDNTRQRLEIYKRLADIKSEQEMWEARQVLEDRFGRIPKELATLFVLIEVRLRATQLGVAVLEKVGGRLQAEFSQPERIDLEKLMPLLNDDSQQVQLLPQDKLVLGPMPETPEAVLERLKILKEIVQPLAA